MFAIYLGGDGRSEGWSRLPEVTQAWNVIQASVPGLYLLEPPLTPTRNLPVAKLFPVCLLTYPLCDLPSPGSTAVLG